MKSLFISINQVLVNDNSKPRSRRALQTLTKVWCRLPTRTLPSLELIWKSLNTLTILLLDCIVPVELGILVTGRWYLAWTKLTPGVDSTSVFRAPVFAWTVPGSRNKWRWV